MAITHTTAEFMALTRAFAILVTALDARNKIDGRAIAANLRATAREVQGCDEFQELIADMITRTIDKFEDQGAVKLAIVDKSPD